MIEVNLGKIWCSFHALPWKKTWPDPGAIVAALRLFDVYTADETIAERADHDVEKLGPILAEFYPWCCDVARRDPNALAEAYERAGVAPPTLQG